MRKKRGVGRPKIAQDKRRVDLSTKVAPTTKSYLEAESERLSVSIGFLIDSMVEERKTVESHEKSHN